MAGLTSVCVCVCVRARVGIYDCFQGQGSLPDAITSSTQPPVYPGSKTVFRMHDISFHFPMPLCSLVLQYLLNTLSITYGTTLFRQRLAGFISPFLICLSVSMMSPSNLPLFSHALCSSVTSATKLTVTYCVQRPDVAVVKIVLLSLWNSFIVA